MRDYRSDIEWRSVDSIIPYINNTKQHSDEQVAKIAGSIAEFGFDQPMVVDGNHVLIKGHGRLLAARKLGLTQVPVLVRTDLTPTQVKAARIADNKVAESEWDQNLLKLELIELKASDFDLGLTGFDPIEVDELLSINDYLENDPIETGESISKSDECQTKWQVEVGDLWQCGDHRILCGDALDASAVQRLLNHQQPNMVLTDPPYGMNLFTDFSKMKGKLGCVTTRNNYNAIQGDTGEFDSRLITTVFDYFKECEQLFLFGADYFFEHIPNRNAGALFVWDKKLDHQTNTLTSDFELFWSKHKHRRRILRHDWFGFLSASNPEEARNRYHPTQKPTSLLIDIMQRFGKERDLVVDLYLGSGSLILACEKSNRIGYGCELLPEYVSVCLERWQLLTQQQPVKVQP